MTDLKEENIYILLDSTDYSGDFVGDFIGVYATAELALQSIGVLQIINPSNQRRYKIVITSLNTGNRELLEIGDYL